MSSNISEKDRKRLQKLAQFVVDNTAPSISGVGINDRCLMPFAGIGGVSQCWLRKGHAKSCDKANKKVREFNMWLSAELVLDLLADDGIDSEHD